MSVMLIPKHVLGGTGVDGRIILKWIFVKWDEEDRLIWLMKGQSAGSCE
jgi:hypothetical protein